MLVQPAEAGLEHAPRPAAARREQPRQRFLRAGAGRSAAIDGQLGLPLLYCVLVIHWYAGLRVAVRLPTDTYANAETIHMRCVGPHAVQMQTASLDMSKILYCPSILRKGSVHCMKHFSADSIRQHPVCKVRPGYWHAPRLAGIVP